jgi:hypothetical protein
MKGIGHRVYKINFQFKKSRGNFITLFVERPYSLQRRLLLNCCVTLTYNELDHSLPAWVPACLRAGINYI